MGTAVFYPHTFIQWRYTYSSTRHHGVDMENAWFSL